MSRLKLIGLWLVCVVFAGPLLAYMLIQAVFGSETRALYTAVGFDCAANGLFGGKEYETISTRTGNALILGRRWAQVAAPIIDFFMGAGHCLANATLTLPS
jgi:hypothetical protein